MGVKDKHCWWNPWGRHAPSADPGEAPAVSGAEDVLKLKIVKLKNFIEIFTKLSCEEDKQWDFMAL